MKENKYDDKSFFEKYSGMERSKNGLDGAGEWHVLKDMLPDFTGKKVLDLGCGFGWHLFYAASCGMERGIGIDISSKMIEEALSKNEYENIKFICMPIEDIDFEEDSFDIVMSSLAFHYIESFGEICKKVKKYLKKGGEFVFSVEHPVFTAYGTGDWIFEGEDIKHWPVDNYFSEGKRTPKFLGEEVVKYHRTLTTYIKTLLDDGFEILDFAEPMPDDVMLKNISGMKDELRRPMMLIIRSRKL